MMRIEILAYFDSSFLFSTSQDSEENLGKSDLNFLLKYLEKKRFINFPHPTLTHRTKVLVTVEGYAHMESLQSLQVESN